MSSEASELSDAEQGAISAEESLSDRSGRDEAGSCRNRKNKTAPSAPMMGGFHVQSAPTSGGLYIPDSVLGVSRGQTDWGHTMEPVETL